jgi:hypothetical protein
MDTAASDEFDEDNLNNFEEIYGLFNLLCYLKSRHHESTD